MKGNIIEEYKLGNTTIKINDLYIDYSEENKKKVLKRITDIVMNAKMKSSTEKKKEAEKI